MAKTFTLATIVAESTMSVNVVTLAKMFTLATIVAESTMSGPYCVRYMYVRERDLRDIFSNTLNNTKQV